MTMIDPVTIMLVDDEKDIRDVLSIVLSDIGYTVSVAENGEKALEHFKTEMFPIVLTDIKMPGMDGVELLKRIKQENPDTEVIMMTGHGDMDLAIKSLKYKAIDFIPKPINDDVLELTLKKTREKIITRQQLKDYTEKLERLLQEKTELQDHLSSLGIMMGTISHGIKGLLTRLDAGVYLIESAQAKDEIREGVEILKHTVGRIKKIVLDILYYAKERNLKIQKTDIIRFAGDVANIIEQKTNVRDIKFIRDFGKNSIESEIDSEFLHSALINILDNAVDACEEDSTKQSHKITFGVKQINGNVIFDVYDNGPGMDSKTKENIFNLFYSSKGSKGTGFGLFIADNIIKQHRGTIKVNSIAGKGTHFSIRIPKFQSKKG